MVTKDQPEQLCIDGFKEPDWEYECGYDIAPDSENLKNKEVLITDCLRDSLVKTNPKLLTGEIDLSNIKLNDEDSRLA